LLCCGLPVVLKRLGHSLWHPNYTGFQGGLVHVCSCASQRATCTCLPGFRKRSQRPCNDLCQRRFCQGSDLLFVVL
jgi:hypothetical protein